MKRVYILLRTEYGGAGTSVYGVFENRSGAEHMLKVFVSNYIDRGWVPTFPNEDDRDGFVCLFKSHQNIHYVWRIQTEPLLDLKEFHPEIYS